MSIAMVHNGVYIVVYLGLANEIITVLVEWLQKLVILSSTFFYTLYKISNTLKLVIPLSYLTLMQFWVGK